jgi:putative nucleotidyltransferase-like protein
LELLPPSIHNRALLSLLGAVLAPPLEPDPTGLMRLRLFAAGFSWQSLVDLAVQQDVLAPLVFALSRRGLLLPAPRSAPSPMADVTARCLEFYRQHEARRQLETEQLIEIIAALNAANITPLLLKGARYLIAPTPQWTQARSMRDIDVLVLKADADRAFAALKATGYWPDAAYMADYHHLPVLFHASRPAAVEIHTDSLSLAAQKALTTEQVWKVAIPAKTKSCLILPLYWQAVHCLLHHQIADCGYDRRVLALKALWEWTMLSDGFSNSDWENVTEYMQRAGAADALGSFLIQSRELFGIELPKQISISQPANANALATIDRIRQPYWRRRARFVYDQTRLSFSRQVLAQRYGNMSSPLWLIDAGRNALGLLKRHRGRWLRRLIGHTDRSS